MRNWALTLVCVTLLLTLNSLAAAEDAPPESKSQVLELADGKLRLLVPDEWEKVAPRVRIIEHEFSAPAATGNKQPGRVTIMRSGGTIEANIQRWKNQFSLPRGVDPQEAIKTEQKTVAGLTVHVVDITGTYRDTPRGPFGPKMDRPDYRMLATIIQTRDAGNYFLKFYGPRSTIERYAKPFQQMIDSIKWDG